MADPKRSPKKPSSSLAAEDAARARRARLLAPLCAAALVLLFHYRLALPGRALVANDFRALFIPLRAGLQNAVRAGEWPLWQRGIFLGYPVLGDIQFQIFNPLTWLTLPLPAARGITVQSLLELCLCAAGMVVWMRQRGLGAIEGVFAGVVFALGLKQTVHLHHWTFASSTCAWPWIFAGLDGFARTGRARWFVLAAGAACGSWLGASPQMAWFGSALGCLYALALLPRLLEHGRAHALAAVCAVPLGLLLAAPLLLPVAELSALGPRGAGITYRFASSWSWPDRSVWTAMLLPRAWSGRSHYRGPLNYWEVQGYLGLLPMALFAALPRRRQLWPFLLAGGLGIWVSFGESSFLSLHHFAFRFLPGYGGFRNPTRALMLTSFCSAVLAAEGLARLRADPVLRARVLAALGVLGALVGYLSLVPGQAFAPSLRADAFWAGAILAACGAWAVFARAGPRWAALAIPLFLGDMAVQAWDSPEIGPADAEGRALLAFASAIPTAPAPRRVAVMGPWGELNNATYLRDWEGLLGYGPVPIARVHALLEATFTDSIPAPRPLDDDPNFPRIETASPLIPLFATPLIIANRDASATPLLQDGDERLYGLPSLPRVFWTGGVRIASDEQASPLLLLAARGRFALLSQPAAGVGQNTAEAGPVAAEGIEVRTRTLDAVVNAPADGLAVVLDPWFPGWTATVDGAPAPLLRADFAFLAVPLRQGRHQLHLSYAPARLLPGVYIALLAALLVLVCALKLRRVDSPPPRGYFPPP